MWVRYGRLIEVIHEALWKDKWANEGKEIKYFLRTVEH